MIFIFLVFLAAFCIEGIGTYVSVVGLSAIFAASPVVIVLSVALDYGKVITVSFLYKHWASLKWPMKVYMTLATIVLVSITSAGAFGFLSGEFQKAIADTGTQSIKIQTLEEEKGRLQKRKEEIDAQIAKVPDKNVRGRTQLIKQFGPEVSKVNERLAKIDVDLPELKIKNIDKELHVGPIIYVAKAFNTTPEEAVKWVILIIMIVFDPLAISLLIAGNFLLELRNKSKSTTSKFPCRLCHTEYESASSAEVCEHSHADEQENVNISGQSIASIKPPITADQMELVPVEEPPQTPEPDCAYCEGEGEHEVAPNEFVPCGSCTTDGDEAEVVLQPSPTTRLVMKEKDGRDVISLSTPRSALEDVNVNQADIIADDGMATSQTMNLRNHYLDNPMTQPPVVVGTSK